MAAYALSSSPPSPVPITARHATRLAWEEARPIVQLIFQLRFATGVVLGSGPSKIAYASVVPAMVGWLAATWAIYLLNGVADVVEDRANGSQRPIARGLLPEAAARRFCGVLAVVAVLSCALVSVPMVVLVVLMLAVGFGYSLGPFPFKMTVPTFVVSVTLLGLLTYLAGCCAVGRLGDGPLFLVGIVMSLWMGLVGSTKDLSDVEGDRQAGRRTLPVLLGERRARSVLAAQAMVVGVLFLVSATTWARWLVPAAVVVGAGALAVAIVALAPLSRENRSARRRPYRIFMATQYAVHFYLLCSAVAF